MPPSNNVFLSIPDQNLDVKVQKGMFRVIWCRFDGREQGWRIQTIERIHEAPDGQPFSVSKKLLRIVIDHEKALKCGRYCNPRTLLGI
jgi:hypothetical protein